MTRIAAWLTAVTALGVTTTAQAQSRPWDWVAARRGP
jgi:hypothetical protein